MTTSQAHQESETTVDQDQDRQSEDSDSRDYQPEDSNSQDGQLEHVTRQGVLKPEEPCFLNPVFKQGKSLRLNT